MILSDVHVHSAFSSDGISPLADMVSAAHKKGLGYLGVSEHFDCDYEVFGVKINGKPVPQINAGAYFEEARRLQADYSDKGLRLLVGGEYGWGKDERCFEQYERYNRKYAPDFVVNSVHTVKRFDVYFPDHFANKSKEQAYREYLETVRESLDAPYSYDVVGHIGYVARNAPYADKKLRYIEFADILDEILSAIVAKNKILEVNSSARQAGSNFLPDTDILTRYFELGGRQISFASDAHERKRIAEKRDTVCAALKKIGFTEITVPNCGKRIKLKIRNE